MPRPIAATIDVAAFRHNYLIAKRYAGEAPAFAVIKSNAYGHGLVRCAEAIADCADGYAMLDFAEAASLREAGIRQPIVLLEGGFEAGDAAEASRLGLTLAVHEPGQIRMLELDKVERPVDVFLKLNTGMNRLGFRPDQAAAQFERLRACPNVGRITLMTHFARADDEVGIREALGRFDSAAVPADTPHCVANSAALLRFPEAVRSGGVRPGIILYGCSPMPASHSAESLGLKPVMHLTSRIIDVQQVPVGETVGYGGRFTASRPTRVGIVACGYADGYPRHAESGTPILVAGHRTGTLGRVSMDMLACDLTDLPEAGIGSEVVLWGSGMPADEVASAAGTISYEMLCALAARVPVSVRGA